MPVEDAIVARINGLIGEAVQLRQTDDYGHYRTEAQGQECRGWLAAAVNIIQVVVPDPNSAYRQTAEAVANRDHGFEIPTAVGEVSAILVNLLGDAQAGLITSVADNVRAEVFDDFLDHAKAYQRDGRKNEAGVISGVVFEDSIRRVCRKHDLEERGVRLDDLISALSKANILSATKAKRARVAAHVRTKATHAQWDEFDEDDLSTAVEFTEELIARYVEQ